MNKLGELTFGDNDLDLISVLAAQAGVVLEQAGMREQVIQKKRLQAELDLAQSIQQRLLPSHSPTLPALEIAGHSCPATETSGDYFDYLHLDNGKFALVIADVTGHGLGAALISTAARAYIRALCETESSPERILAAANRLLVRDLEDGNFLSLCLAVFDPHQNELTYSSAGHDPPILYRPGADSFAELSSTGPLLGILPEAEFAAAGPFPLMPGDILVFMTDGLFECTDEKGESLGKERLMDVIRECASNPASALLGQLRKRAALWMAGRPPKDDITVAVVKVVDAAALNSGLYKATGI